MKELLCNPASLGVLAAALLTLPAMASSQRPLAGPSSLAVLAAKRADPAMAPGRTGIITAAGPPAQQEATDIGQPATPGRSSVLDGTYSIEAGGIGIGGSADQFHFIYQALTGDGEITAHVMSVLEAGALAKAGVMIRESLTAGSRHATMVLSAGRGYAFQRRPETAGATLQTAGSWLSPPGWVRLVRTGDLFEAYQSLNGTTWVKIGSDTIPMGATVYVGLAATSQNAISATTVRIDGLSVVWKPPPNEPPAVSITSPTAQSQYTAPGPVTIQAVATDPEGRLSAVDFYADSTLIGRDDTAPYAIPWATSTPATYSLTAVAMDADGGTTTSGAVPVIIAAPNQPPVVSLTSPWSGTSFPAPATINVTANASDPEGQLTRVEFYNGATLLGSDTTAPYAFSWTNVVAGVYTLTVAAYDGAGSKATSTAATVTVGMSNAPPTVSLTSPANGTTLTAPATISLASNATDAEGPVARVEFFSGGTRLATDPAAPYEFSWTGVPAGTYSLAAVAYDSAGASATTAAVTVTVQNALSPLCLVVFGASADHQTNVISYFFEVFAAGGGATTAVASADLGKPAPGPNNDITSDQSTLFSNLAPGAYLATVTAIGPGGSTPSATVSFTR